MSKVITPEMREFRERAAETKFAIETSMGFWNKEEQLMYPTIENSSTFNWLDQEDHLTEVMEEISMTKGAWFRVVTVEPFKKQ